MAALLFALNFFTDKFPYVDSINDMLHTFVRVPAGALWPTARPAAQPGGRGFAGLLGGTLAAGTHVAKTGTRALINTSPEPFSNIAASLRRGHQRDRRTGRSRSPIRSHSCALLALFPWPSIWLLPKLVRLALVPFRRLAGIRQKS